MGIILDKTMFLEIIYINVINVMIIASISSGMYSCHFGLSI